MFSDVSWTILDITHTLHHWTSGDHWNVTVTRLGSAGIAWVNPHPVSHVVKGPNEIWTAVWVLLCPDTVCPHHTKADWSQASDWIVWPVNPVKVDPVKLSVSTQLTFKPNMWLFFFNSCPPCSFQQTGNVFNITAYMCFLYYLSQKKTTVFFAVLDEACEYHVKNYHSILKKKQKTKFLMKGVMIVQWAKWCFM